MKIGETIKRAYGTYETQHGRNAEMPVSEIRNRTDLTEDQIKQGLAEISRNGQGRPGDLGYAAGILERF